MKSANKLTVAWLVVAGIITIATSALAAPDSYCPTHSDIKNAVKDYALASENPGLSQQDRQTLKTAYEGRMAVAMMGHPRDVEVFCTMIAQRELLQSLVDRENRMKAATKTN